MSKVPAWLISLGLFAMLPVAVDASVSAALRPRNLSELIANAASGTIYTPIDFFQNSVRRDGTTLEARSMLNLRLVNQPDPFPHCTAFFVKNKAAKPLVATARHCLEYRFSEACEASQFIVTTEAGSHLGSCARVVAGSYRDDLIIFEASFDDWFTIKNEIAFLRLSSQRPQIHTPLELRGYPIDRYRNGRFTITENCWVNEGLPVDGYDLTPAENAEFQAAMARFKEKNIPLERELPEAGLIENRTAAFHNCSVYGGNSGGPLLEQGTDIVLGLPTTFLPFGYTLLPSSRAAAMDSTADFIVHHQKAIAREGIVIASPY